MDLSLVAICFLLFASVLANFPWFSERPFFFFPPPSPGGKPLWMYLLEWLLLYGLTNFVAFGLEHKVTGGIHEKGWVFYTIGFCMFLILASPGFIYRFGLLKYIKSGG